MRRFSRLYAAIDESNKTNDKVTAMADYFREAPPEDAAWAVHFLIGRRPKRLVQGPKMFGWAAEAAGIPLWLFAESYDAVGDLAEAVALVLPESGLKDSALSESPEQRQEVSLHQFVETRLLPLGKFQEEEQKESLIRTWFELDRLERFVFNKLITGALRVGVSQDLVVRALSQASGISPAVLSHRLMGWWHPTADFFRSLLAEDSSDTDISRPYPFCLAHPLADEPKMLGEIQDWHIEWKWDGIRAQLIRRQGRSFIWSRGEDLINERFPEILEVCDTLPDGTVLDGEILAWKNGKPMKFLDLQKRIGRKVLSKKILQDVPVVLVAFDILEHEGDDLRDRPLAERRVILEHVVDDHNDRHISGADIKADPALAVEHSEGASRYADSRLLLSREVLADSWVQLADQRQRARDLAVEGLMLKRCDSPYLVGRKKGFWWKWKIEPFTVDAVLIYAQPGNGRRASLFTDYTFGVWSDEGQLVPFAKAYSGLSDDEIRQVDAWVRRNTVEKFGPVRSVKHELVMELAFEGIQLSSRHKSGVAVRFPRISRWRLDKKPEDADSLKSIKDMLLALG